MKLFITTACLALFSAFQTNAQINIGIEGGASFNNMTQKINGSYRNNQGQVGYNGGFSVNIPLQYGSHFHIKTGLLFDANSGSESNYSSQSATGSGVPIYEEDYRKYRVNSLMLPAYLVYKTGDPIYDHNHLFVGIGAAFAYTVGGQFHQIYTNRLNGNPRTRDNNGAPLRIGTGHFKDYYDFNLGLGATIGCEFSNGMYAKAHYTQFVINTNPLKNSNNVFYASQAGLSIGYYFHTFKSNKQ
ncbi:MAG TPA: outer membrane beta-barrel protein [Edaphocola sp.]|nr:outer membrane beta-barrel protein [Edaphocola sp.]